MDESRRAMLNSSPRMFRSIAAQSYLSRPLHMSTRYAELNQISPEDSSLIDQDIDLSVLALPDEFNSDSLNVISEDEFVEFLSSLPDSKIPNGQMSSTYSSISPSSSNFDADASHIDVSSLPDATDVDSSTAPEHYGYTVIAQSSLIPEDRSSEGEISRFTTVLPTRAPIYRNPRVSGDIQEVANNVDVNLLERSLSNNVNIASQSRRFQGCEQDLIDAFARSGEIHSNTFVDTTTSAASPIAVPNHLMSRVSEDSELVPTQRVIGPAEPITERAVTSKNSRPLRSNVTVPNIVVEFLNSVELLVPALSRANPKKPKTSNTKPEKPKKLKSKSGRKPTVMDPRVVEEKIRNCQRFVMDPRFLHLLKVNFSKTDALNVQIDYLKNSAILTKKSLEAYVNTANNGNFALDATFCESLSPKSCAEERTIYERDLQPVIHAVSNLRYYRNNNFGRFEPYTPQWIRFEVDDDGENISSTKAGCCAYCPNTSFYDYSSSGYLSHMSTEHGIFPTNYIVPDPINYGYYYRGSGDKILAFKKEPSFLNNPAFQACFQCPQCLEVVRAGCQQDKKIFLTYFRHFKCGHKGITPADLVNNLGIEVTSPRRAFNATLAE